MKPKPIPADSSRYKLAYAKDMVESSIRGDSRAVMVDMSGDRHVLLRVPVAPTINHGGYWAFSPQRMSMYKTKAGGEFVRAVERVMIDQLGIGSWEPFKKDPKKVTHIAPVQTVFGDADVSVTIYIIPATTASDIDNRVKPVLDSLTGWLYDDDKQVVCLQVCKPSVRMINAKSHRGGKKFRDLYEPCMYVHVHRLWDMPEGTEDNNIERVFDRFFNPLDY